MGIKKLNQYIVKHCSKKSIQDIHLSSLSRRSIVVDISIYLYKYESINSLLENIYLMISIFKFYNINIIFIFDGKPSSIKLDTIKRRKIEKIKAINEYKILNDELILQQQLQSNKGKTDVILSKMKMTKQKIIWMTAEKISKIKQLATACGIPIYTSEYESDGICAQLVITQKVWACLSDDMDMFVYGCPRVLRYFNINTHTVAIYHTDQIMNELKVNQSIFREICVLSGTDYNFTDDSSFEIDNLFKLYIDEYIKITEDITFYEWLVLHKNMILNMPMLQQLNAMFEQLTDPNIRKISIKNKPPQKDKIMEIMEPDGFIFV